MLNYEMLKLFLTVQLDWRVKGNLIQKTSSWNLGGGGVGGIRMPGICVMCERVGGGGLFLTPGNG